MKIAVISRDLIESKAINANACGRVFTGIKHLFRIKNLNGLAKQEYHYYPSIEHETSCSQSYFMFVSNEILCRNVIGSYKSSLAIKD